MPRQTYIIWRSGSDFHYRTGHGTMSIPWDLQRERELQRLIATWEEKRPETEKMIAGRLENIDEGL